MTDNTMIVVGNLVSDPELRFTSNGVALAKFPIASTPRVFDKATNQYADGDPLFLTCTVWRDLAINVAESLTKGARVMVTGRLKLSRWETPEGEKRSTYGLDVDDIGPSLRFAQATVKKLARGAASAGTGAAHPLTTTSDQEPSAIGASETPPF